MQIKIAKIISGGQTGVDRAALDFAIENGIETGGYIPRGRAAEDGQIPAIYPRMIEAETSDPSERTMLNVRHSDATLILSHGDLSGGSKLTEQFALEFNKPVLHIDLLKYNPGDAASITRKWLAATNCKTLNVAGPRASEEPAIYGSVIEVFRMLFAHRV